MAIISKSFQAIIVFNATESNKAIIKKALSEDYKLFFVNTVADAMRTFLKYGKKVLEFVVDTTGNSELSISFVREWENDLAIQIVPLVAILDLEKREIERLLINHSVSSLMYLPIDEKKISQHVKTTARRYQLNQTRINELYDSVLKNAREKVFIVSEAVDAGILFLKIEDEVAYVDYTNKKLKEICSFKDFDGLLDFLGLEGGSKFMTMLNKSRINYEANAALIKTNIHDEDRTFEVIIRQIPNIDRQTYDGYVYKFIVTFVERTIRENLKQKYQRNHELMSSILENINGGVILFTSQDHKITVDFVSDGIYKYTGFPHDADLILARMIPASTYRQAKQEFYDRYDSILAGQEETVVIHSKIICFEHVSKHAQITIAFSKIGPNTISCKCLILDDTETYDYAYKLKKLSEFDPETNLFNYNKFVNASTKLYRSNDELEYRLLVFRIYKYDELVSFFGREKVLELLRVITDGVLKFTNKTLKGRVDPKTFALSYIKGKFDEKKFIEELDNYVKENYKIYQVKLYYGIYTLSDVYETVNSLLVQTKYAIKEIEGSALKNSVYCDHRLKSRMIETDNITNEMKQALANNEFEIFLQPVYDLKTRQIVSAEALTRWHHPKRGYISPAEYVPIFEENGFIVNVDNYVWESVCKIIRCWLDNGVRAVPISVNVSRIDLFSIDFYEVITGLVEKYNIPIEFLRIEITESAFVLNEKTVIEIVDKLRNYGFKILMDDFGSGYSSLNSLKFINVDFLKIDMDLVKGMEESIKQANILKSVINLGTTLNLEMICEGVETEKQADFVNDCGCAKAQGWLFSKAIPVDEFNKKLKN